MLLPDNIDMYLTSYVLNINLISPMLAYHLCCIRYERARINVIRPSQSYGSMTGSPSMYTCTKFYLYKF